MGALRNRARQRPIEIAYLAIRQDLPNGSTVGSRTYPLAIGLTEDAALKGLLDALNAFDVANPTLRRSDAQNSFERYTPDGSFCLFTIITVEHNR